MPGPTLVRVVQWWEIRRVYDDNYVKSERLQVFKRKKEALQYLRQLRKRGYTTAAFKLCRTTEKTTFEYRKD